MGIPPKKKEKREKERERERTRCIMHLVPIKIDQTKKVMKWYHNIQTSCSYMST